MNKVYMNRRMNNNINNDDEDVDDYVRIELKI